MYLSEINIYPIKSLGGISLTESVIEEKGLQYDRRWMLVDENGDFLSQREHPRMATFKMSLTENGLGVTHDNDHLEIPFEPLSKEKIKVRIWNDVTDAVPYPEEINVWFSRHLAKNCRLVKMQEETRREVDPEYAIRQNRDVVSFADGYPFLLIGENSLHDLNSRLDQPIPMNRFRPNLVVSGTEPFEEGNWKQVRIGETVFHSVKPCARCVMTTIDQNTGLSNAPEPLKTLSKYRLVRKNGKSKILFGENLIAEAPGKTIRLRDKVEVVEVLIRLT